MATIKYETPNSTETILTTELNSLANSANKLSAALSNDAAGELYLYADFEIALATQGVARDAGAYVALYIIIELDGTNYGYGSDSVDPPASSLVGTFQLSATTGAEYAHIRGVELPPTDFKVLVINETGQAFASSGNTLKYARYNLQSA